MLTVDFGFQQTIWWRNALQLKCVSIRVAKPTKYEKFEEEKICNGKTKKKKHLHSEPLSHVLYQICGLLSEIYFFVDIDTMTSAWWILQLFYCEIPFLISAIAATTTSHLTNKKQNRTKNNVSIRFRFQEMEGKRIIKQPKSSNQFRSMDAGCVWFFQWFFGILRLLLVGSDNKFGSPLLSKNQKNRKK